MPAPATPARFAVLLFVGLGFGCSEGTEAERAFVREADAIEQRERAGAIGDAATQWRALADDAPTRELRARAELGQARCDAALAARDHGRRLLEGLPDRVEGHSLATLDAIAAEQAARFVGGPFEREFRELQDRTRERCKARWQDLRGRQAAIVREIIGRGEFTAALDYLQQLERGRSPDDRSDIPLLLDELGAASDRAAEEVLAQVAEIAATDPVAALTAIDEALPRFHGSSGASKLARSRVERAEAVRNPSPVRKPTGEKSPPKPSDEP
ncbi:MAG: hypothetical protein IPH13_14740 [Planctomycetes bacterium]|nr:hypothetical protein [Planctomycetota bacterium]MCC7170948.1 hypothetical protein [Planctomycetota bacterium]